MHKLTQGLMAVAVVFGLSACESSTGLDGQGQVRVAATGDAGGTGGTQSASPMYSQSFAAENGRAEGTVQFRARVYVMSDAGEWVEVTSQAAQSTTVNASGEGEAVTVAQARVESNTYQRVRVEFEEVRANVTGGVTIGVGQLLTGEVQVALGGSERAVVEREINLNVESGTTAQLLLDLNSQAWLSRADSQSRTVSRAEFESAVRVIAQQQ